MASTTHQRNKRKISAAFTDSAGVAADPTAVVFEVKAPGGEVAGYAYGLTSQGNWSAATNTPALVDGTGTAGFYYTVTAAGSVDFGNGLVTFAVGDYVYYNGDVWQRLQNPSSIVPIRESTGNYYVHIYLDNRGIYRYRVEGIGTGQAADGGYLNVKNSRFRKD